MENNYHPRRWLCYQSICIRKDSITICTIRQISVFELLTKDVDKAKKTFINLAEKKISDYYGEQESNSESRPSIGSSGSDADVLGTRGSIGQGTEPARSGESGSVPPVVQTGLQLGGERRGSNKLASGERIFSYAEWKSNDVAFGEKPKEIWNSESGLPMPYIEIKAEEPKEGKKTTKGNKKKDKAQLSLDLFSQVEAENEDNNQNEKPDDRVLGNDAAGLSLLFENK